MQIGELGKNQRSNPESPFDYVIRLALLAHHFAQGRSGLEGAYAGRLGFGNNAYWPPYPPYLSIYQVLSRFSFSSLVSGAAGEGLGDLARVISLATAMAGTVNIK